MSDGELVVPVIMPKVLADVLAACAQAGFTFRVWMHNDTWVVRLSR